MSEINKKLTTLIELYDACLIESGYGELKKDNSPVYSFNIKIGEKTNKECTTIWKNIKKEIETFLIKNSQ